MGIENPIHLLFIAVVALIVLGPKRLPDLARAVGQGVREFRSALQEGAQEPPQPPAPPAHGEMPTGDGATGAHHQPSDDQPQPRPGG